MNTPIKDELDTLREQVETMASVPRYLTDEDYCDTLLRIVRLLERVPWTAR